jgi:hypothetical protein
MQRSNCLQGEHAFFNNVFVAEADSPGRLYSCTTSLLWSSASSARDVGATLCKIWKTFCQRICMGAINTLPNDGVTNMCQLFVDGTEH